MRERNREKEEWRKELGFGEGEQKFWISGLILPWRNGVRSWVLEKENKNFGYRV